MINNLFILEEREKLKWKNEPMYWEYTKEDGLIMDASANADFFKDPGGKHIAESAPFLYVQVDSSFQLTTQIQVDMLHLYDSGCLMLMADDNNWAKLCFEFNGEYATIVSVVTKNGSSDDCNSERVMVETPYLRIEKNGLTISFYYSIDGQDWKLIRYFGMESSTPFIAGVVAQSPMGSGCRVNFKYLSLSSPNRDSRF
ncbi:regulation of enolase protein 1 (concanavalin A-like superfamily) [Paenibacillus anaericanus]|uniref:DUF1349 domain-containing protein n=1 Tax=Paenibacillus anaericanus TaxID=170367 RepID=UPI002789F8B0|nr:DUF1349 domain-containing protein [Paenibacillus anaericanus]MDQ0086717.1 regulation of enolase protein 1 (concanavalin A-like superfamily) [Paenibacillus anaericanus]